MIARVQQKVDQAAKDRREIVEHLGGMMEQTVMVALDKFFNHR